MLVVGCTTVDDASPPPGPLPATGWISADRDTLADGGTLRLAIDSMPTTYQPYSVDALDAGDLLVADLYLPSFVSLKADGSWVADPDYATEVALVSADPQVVHVQINPDAQWSDGTPLTVDDVAATWQALNGTDEDYDVWSTAVWRDVESVTAGTDDRDVIITFATPNADWPAALSYINPVWAVDTPEHFDEAWRHGPFAADGTTYVSGGPFVVTKIDAKAQAIVLARNPSWWGNTPKLDSVVFTAVTRTSQGQAFANREIDAVNLNSDADTYRTAKGRADATVVRSRGSVSRQITLNAQAPALSDVRVRQAFALSLDREVLAQAVVSGVDSPVLTLDNLLFSPGQYGYEDHMSPLLEGGVDKARTLLADAGYDMSGKKATKGGKPLTVRMVIPGDVPASASVAQLVAQQTAKAGITVKIDAVPYEKYWDYLQTGDFDATYFALVGEAFPVASSQPMYYPSDSPANFAGITDDALGDLWLEANAELDPQVRTVLANGIDEHLVAMVTVIPLFSEPDAWGITSNLRNYGPSQFESVRWEDVGFVVG
ncbi:MAG: ABC transporter family substrate-binding protein [Micrococcales bacterium]|nr:ABC transporter family substrate-binding protein [Micrococcales bacterium]